MPNTWLVGTLKIPVNLSLLFTNSLAAIAILFLAIGTLEADGL